MGHAHSHGNVQPGEYGMPMFKHHMDQQILDALHLAELGLPKTPWKYGILNNASDDARQAISDQLVEWKHPLDCRRKDDGRVRAAKWFTGESWASFCAGERGSPGGPVAMAKLVLIIAEDMQRTGTLGADLGPCAAPAEATGGGRGGRGGGGGRGDGRGGGRGRGRLAMAERMATTMAMEAAAVSGGDGDVLQAERAQVRHIPTAMEAAADPEEITMIRTLYGSRAQTLINALLALDSYFAWYYPFKKSIPFLAPMEQREARALENCRTAIDMHEMFERVSIRNHGYFLPHGAIFKVSRDILTVADLWAVNLSPLELQNAETKRTASTGGSRRLATSSSGQARKPMRGSHEGPARLVPTRGYSTTMALSTLKNLLATQYLRRGDGIIATPESRVGRLASSAAGA